MLTPRFSCSQDEKWIHITIKTPHVKFQEAEFEIQANTFYFYCKPYLLRLHFTSQLANDGSEEGQFSVEHGEFTIQLPKLVEGEHFEDLDMLTKLLTPRVTKDGKGANNLIEVVETPASVEDCDTNEPCESQFEWLYPQKLPDESDVFEMKSRYGFLNKKDGLFSVKSEEAVELLCLGDPDVTPANKRSQLEEQEEDERFDELHFMNNMINCDDELPSYLSMNGLLHLRLQTLQDKGDRQEFEKLLKFTSEEMYEMTTLPRKEYLTNTDQERSLYLGLIDLLFSLNYQYRFESRYDDIEEPFCFGTEAPCSITRLSPMLSWLVEHRDLSSTVRSLLRRALTQPYFRNWILCMQVIDDVVTVLRLGKQLVLKYLLGLRRIFKTVDPYYIMNDLYVTDYCVWLQTCHQSHLDSLATALESFEISPGLVGLGVAQALQNTHDGTVAELLSDSEYEECDESSLDSTSGTCSDLDSDNSLEDDTAILPDGGLPPQTNTIISSTQHQTAKSSWDGPGQEPGLRSHTSLLDKMMDELRIDIEGEEPTDNSRCDAKQERKPLIEVIEDS